MKPDWKDAEKVKPGKKVKTRDGREGYVKGAYLSSEGIVLMVKDHPERVSASNVPLSQVTEMED